MLIIISSEHQLTLCSVNVLSIQKAPSGSRDQKSKEILGEFPAGTPEYEYNGNIKDMEDQIKCFIQLKGHQSPPMVTSNWHIQSGTPAALLLSEIHRVFGGQSTPPSALGIFFLITTKGPWKEYSRKKVDRTFVVKSSWWPASDETALENSGHLCWPKAYRKHVTSLVALRCP